MSQQDDIREAKAVVNTLITRAQLECLEEYGATLRKIALLRWWQVWRAPDMAAYCLGIGKHWNKGQAEAVKRWNEIISREATTKDRP